MILNSWNDPSKVTSESHNYDQQLQQMHQTTALLTTSSTQITVQRVGIIETGTKTVLR